MRKRLSGSSIAVLALVFPIAALADVSNTLTLSSGQHYSFDTGTTSTSGGDLAFTGTSITPQGTAQFSTELGASGAAGYSTLTSQILGFLTYSTAPITGSSLVTDEVIGVKTNGSHYVAVLITSVSASSLSLKYTAFGVTGNSNVPAISAVLDAGSYTASIAQGSIFVIKGTGLSASGLTETSFPLPTSFGGVSIAFAPLKGGTAIQPYIIYLYNQGGVNQLAALLPSTVATGTYNVTVTYNNATSSPVAVTVVKQKPELITADATGGGMALVQNYVSASELDVLRFTTGTAFGSTISPAHPGQTEIAYTVGMGAAPGPDNQASPGYNFLTNGVTVQVTVGSTTITPSYAGRVPGGSGYEQVNFVLPANVQTGCVVPFQLSENGTVTQTGFIAIAPAGTNACVQPGFTTPQLQDFDNGKTTNVGFFDISQFSESAAGQSFSIGSAGGAFTQYTGFELAAIPPYISGGTTPVIPTGCTVIQFNSSTTPTGNVVSGTGVDLDAGNLTLSGPAGSNLNNTPLSETLNFYDLLINGFGSTVNGNIVAGTYTLNGAGGTGVGPFKATLNVGAPVTVTGGLPSVVNRGSGLQLNWTGGSSTDYVAIIGYSANITNSVSVGAEFICYANAGAGGFNVSSSILNQLPAISAAAIANGTASGLLEVSAGTNFTSFTAPLVAGGNITAFFDAASGTAASVVYQ